MSFSTRTTLPARSTDKAGSAGGQRLRRRIHAPKPHEQGAWALRFIPNGANVRVDGGRPTRRGLPPAAVGDGRRRFGRGRRGFGECWKCEVRRERGLWYASRFGRCGVWSLGDRNLGAWGLKVDLGDGSLRAWRLWGFGRPGFGRRMRTRPASPLLLPFRARKRPHPSLPAAPSPVPQPPSTRIPAPSEPHRSAQAPCSWGLGASTRSRRHWQPALPPLDFWGVLL